MFLFSHFYLKKFYTLYIYLFYDFILLMYIKNAKYREQSDNLSGTHHTVSTIISRVYSVSVEPHPHAPCVIWKQIKMLFLIQRLSST